MIAAGYEDANDCDALRGDPVFKRAVGRLPETAAELCSQPTMSRLENLPTATALKRMMAAMVDLFCASFAQVPRRIVLDIDDTEDRVHGCQQLSLFHAHYDSRCFLPIHIYEATTGKPVAVVLRPGKTPDGAEVALVLRHVVRAIRSRWPAVDILIRGDSHYARPEAMTWLERNRVGYIFGLGGNQVLLGKVRYLAEDAAVGRIAGEVAKARRYAEFRYAALGASETSIAKLLSIDFIKLVMIAILIASPIAWYAMNYWLEGFTYRVSISGLIFLYAGSIAIAIALATVSFQSIRAAMMNPVKSLRSE